MTEYGNTWVSDYDWGWAPFHYGRWVNNRYNEWVWIPDTVWSPAWVSWRSGGGYYGNSAMYIPTITLPNSKLRVSLPMYRLVMDSTRLRGHGIIPDLAIPPSSDAIRKGIDQKMLRIREMIQQKAL